MRHDLATKVPRETGNLKLTAELLDHANTVTVSKTYAHVSQTDKVAALERLAEARATQANMQGRDKNPGVSPVAARSKWCKVCWCNDKSAPAGKSGGLGVPSSNLGAPTKKTEGAFECPSE